MEKVLWVDSWTSHFVYDIDQVSLHTLRLVLGQYAKTKVL